MYKIGVLGDKESIIGYKAVGLLTCFCDTREEAAAGLRRLLQDGCVIVYVVEHTAQLIEEEIKQYEDVKLPAIILVPGNRGSLGIGRRNLNRSVEKAVGSNILAEN